MFFGNVVARTREGNWETVEDPSVFYFVEVRGGILATLLCRNVLNRGGGNYGSRSRRDVKLEYFSTHA